MLASAGVLAGAAAPGYAASNLPEIRLSANNPVPACVTPDRLMAFLKTRNGKLDRRFRTIASYYKQHGEAWRVRWDYAFYQMAIETNFLSYRQPNGRMGDVDPKQNNFAGIGTTGGGVPGDSFPDVSTGVLGQIQHLVAYSGEWVAEPVAPRTRLKQEHILAKSHELNRAVRFSDLAGRWAVDRKYAKSIEWVASQYRAKYCTGRNASQRAEMMPSVGAASAKKMPVAVKAMPAPKPQAAVRANASVELPIKKRLSSEIASRKPGPEKAEGSDFPKVASFAPAAALADVKIPQPAKRRERLSESAMGPPAPPPGSGASPAAVSGKTVAGFMMGNGNDREFAPPSGLGVKPGKCMIESARYGGETTVLVKAPAGDDVRYVALSVLDGFEDSMTQTFLSSRAQGGEVIGTFGSRDEALAKARSFCPN